MKLITKQLLLLLLLQISICNHLSAQENIFHLPANIEQPTWYTSTDWIHPNVFFIDSLISEFKKNENKSKIEADEFEEDPYLTAYVRWKIKRFPFIKNDGSIEIDNNYYNRLFQHQSQNRITNAGAWTLVGPSQTFLSGASDKTNTQCNITALAVTPANPDMVLAGAETGVLFKSINKGQTWLSINNDVPSLNTITAIVADPINANKFYYYNEAGLFLTTNGGTTFTRINNFTYGEINRMVINPNTGRLLVASVNGVYYSDNSGTSWSLASGTTSNNNLWDIVQKPGQSNTLYAVGGRSTDNALLLYTSNDGGNSFISSTINDGVNLATTDGARLAVSPANSNYVYCINLQKDTACPILIRSTNSGTSWNVQVRSYSQDFGGSNTNVGLGMSSGQGYYDLEIAVSSSNANHVIVGTTSTFKSTDGGLNFSPIGGYIGNFGYKIHPDIQMMQIIGNDTYLADDGGVVHSTDFFTNDATVVDNGLSASLFWGFGQGWRNDIMVGGRYHNGDAVLNENYGLGKSIYLGGGEDATGLVFKGEENTIGFRDLGVYEVPAQISDPMHYATLQNSKWPQDDYYGLFISRLVQDPRFSFIYYVGYGNAFWKSTNSGASYISLKDFGSKVWRFDISRSDPNVIYVCTQSNGIQKTIDGGQTWTQLNLPSGVNYAYYNTDISISHANANEVLFCMRTANALNKVFKTVDGGATWTNITGNTLFNKEVSYILYHGNNGLMFAVTQTVPCEVYFRDNSMTDWSLFTNGLPKNLQVWGGGACIFFRDNKLRLATTRGIWESTIDAAVMPDAQPMADKSAIFCNRDTVNFYDYSVLNYAGATWHWTFPGASYVSDVASKSPKVLYNTIGSYSVTLQVTDAIGNTHSKTVNNMITFVSDNCRVDSVAGKSLVMKGENTPVSIGTASINSNSFSLSCWIKPDGNQNSFAQLISHDPYPGSSFGFGLGFAFEGYTPNLKLCYTDNIVGYGNASSLLAVSQKWNFVVLTYTPTGVYIYLNGNKQQVYSGNMQPINLSQSPFFINRDIHNQGGYYKGEIDEVKIYNYALSESEIREKMHLVQNNPLTENGLLKYCQFNQYDEASSISYELIDKNRLNIPDISYMNYNSETPVGPGNAYTLTNVNSAGQKDFSGLGMKLFMKQSGTYPNGDLVGFRLRVPPYTKPDTRALSPDSSWFIINNYGANSSFSMLDSLRFENLKLLPNNASANNIVLFKRNAIDHGATWGTEIDSADIKTAGNNNGLYNLTYSTGNRITSFGQFCMVYDSTNQSNNITDTSHNNPGIISPITSVNVNVFPNPSSAQVNIEFNLVQSQKLSIAIYNELGQLVRKIADGISVSAGQYRAIWDGNTASGAKVSSGIYLFSIQGEKGLVKSGKILVTKL